VLPDLANIKEKKFSFNGLKYVLSASDLSAIKSITKDFETLRTYFKPLKLNFFSLIFAKSGKTVVCRELMISFRFVSSWFMT
ncbi:hypothetical protein LF879_16125, partial [Enterococcus faecalis]|uniref:hypothetical protein n=1 Tax=Enterococcus faecalis TaxID=1351 RepID=UPI001CF5EBDE